MIEGRDAIVLTRIEARKLLAFVGFDDLRSAEDLARAQNSGVLDLLERLREALRED